jgi:hypothetical protein
MPMLGSFGFNQRMIGGKHDERPAAINAFGSVTPAAAHERTATKNALAHEPAAVFRSFIYLLLASG